jgi:hypothetical protein
MRHLSSIGLPLLSLLLLCTPAPADPQLLGVKKISDTAPHSAFTDLAYFKDRWYCTFREGAAHVSPDGSICVLQSPDAEKWDRIAHLTRADGDLRDPKLSITPDDRLMLTAAIALPKAGGAKEHRTLVWFSEDGKKWSEPKEIGDVNVWLWRVAWHDGKAFGVGYATAPPSLVRLYESADGSTFKALVPTLFDKGEPSEAGLAFDNDNTCLCLLRRDAKGKAGSAQLGTAKPPYTDWTWKDLTLRVGGPALLRLPDGRFIAAGRFYEPSAHTALAWLDPAAGKLTPFLKFPSSGDTSYPGLVFRDGLLRVSYYSTHEGKTSIYLATVKIN